MSELSNYVTQAIKEEIEASKKKVEHEKLVDDVLKEVVSALKSKKAAKPATPSLKEAIVKEVLSALKSRKV